MKRNNLHLSAAALMCFLGSLIAGCGQGLILGGSFGGLPSVAAIGEPHPFILMRQDAVETVRQRTTREPAASWATQITNDATSRLGRDTPSSPATRLNWARDAALMYVLAGDRRYAEQAAALLAETTLFEEFSETNGPIHTLVGQVPRYCEAYDLLLTELPDQGAPWRISDSDNAKIRDNIAAMARWLREYRPFWYGFVYNNWAIRQYTALALCGMTISDGSTTATPEEAEAWIAYGYREALAAMDRQVCDGGAFAEGCGYMNYAADNYMPFFFACRNKYGDNLFARPAIRLAHEWLTRIRMPSGYLPNFDDSPLVSFPTHYLTSADTEDDNTRAGLFAWDWQMSHQPVVDRCRAICWHDDRVAPIPPSSEPCAVMPEAGTAVLRNSWASDALYLLLIGEHGKARINGYGHEHPDNTSFMIEAFGEQLALDGGYIDYTNHAKVNAPENHNLILVDEEGPFFVQVGNQPLLIDQDAYLSDFEVSGNIPHCAVETSYAGVTLRRTVLMPGRDHFVIIDHIKPAARLRFLPQVLPPQLSWLLHGNAGVPESQGGTGGAFEIDGMTARWSRPSGVSLSLSLVCSSEGLVLKERTLPDGEPYPHQLAGHGPSSILYHRTIEGVVPAREAVFIAALVPTRSPDAAPDTALDTSPAIEDISTPTTIGLRLRFADGRLETVTARRPGRPSQTTGVQNTFSVVGQTAQEEPVYEYSGQY